MISRTTTSFWACFDALPAVIQTRARIAYQKFETDPGHPGLNFEKVHATEPFYSVRVDLRWRAVGRLERDVMTWFWIDHHHKYDRLVRSF